MGGVIKGIGKVVGAVPAGIGHALRTSHIPIVSGLGGTVENAGKAFEGKMPFFKGVLPAAAMGLGGAGLLGAGPLGGLLGGVGGDIGSLAGKIGKALPLGLQGGQGLDVGKLAEGGLGLANVIGAQQQQNAASKYNNAQIDQRNQLMSRILSGTGSGQPYNMQQSQGYNPKQPNLNQQSTATSGGY